MAFIGKAGRVADAVKRSPKLLRKKIGRTFGSHESKLCCFLGETDTLNAMYDFRHQSSSLIYSLSRSDFDV